MSKQKAEKRQKVGRCIFCQREGNLTKEHIWSSWLGEVLPPTSGHAWNFNTDYKAGSGFLPNTNQPIESRQGGLESRTVRKVCLKCNGGWMSAIVQQAKPAAAALIRDIPIELNPQDQRALAAWSSLAATIHDARLPANSVIAQTDRTYFFEKRVPPPSWYVGIARYVDFASRSVVADRNLLRFKDLPMVPTISTWACSIQYYFVYVVSTTYNSAQSQANALGAGPIVLIKIHTSSEQTLHSRQLSTIDANTAHLISKSYIQAVLHAGAAAGYDLRASSA